MKIYVESDVDSRTTRGARVAVVGYGSQGRAHALNLKDSGFDVTVGLREGGPSWRRAEADGMKVATPENAVKGPMLWRCWCRTWLRQRLTRRSPAA